MNLPNDISRCSNTDCELKSDCLRHLDKPNEDYIPFAEFKPVNGKCEYKIEIEIKE